MPADVRRLMYKVKHAQGTDITRIFCGLNDVRNIIPSIKYAIEGGMTPQATLCITTSPIHTAEYYAGIADQLIEAGAPEICLKDMAGIGQPAMLGQLCRMIKEKHPRSDRGIPRPHRPRSVDGFDPRGVPQRLRHYRHRH